MYPKKLLLILPILLLAFSTEIKAQEEDCSFTLTKAQKLFDAGTIEQIPKMLQPCIDQGFSEEDKLQAYKLIILSYLFDNNMKEAENAMLNFLNKYPEYEILPADPAEFIQLFNTYNTIPVASFGAVAGTNFSNIRAINLYGTDNTKGTYSSTGFSFQAGLAYRRYLTPKFDLSIEGIYLQTSYQYANPNLDAGKQLTFTETQSRIEIPLTTIYTPVKWGKFSPYVRAGFNTTYLLTDAATLLNTDTYTSKPTTNTGSMSDKRIPLQFWGILGGGIGFNFTKSCVMLDIRYNRGFNMQNNNHYIKADLDQQNVSGYSENDFKMSDFFISLSYFYKFYKPEKKKIKK